MTSPQPSPDVSESVHKSSPQSGTAAPPSSSAIFVRVMTFAVAGLAAAALAAQAIGATAEVFQLPPELVALGVGSIPGPEAQAKIAAGNKVVASKHAALWMGITGAILAGGFCLAGLVSGGKKPAVLGIVPGIFCAAAVGGLAGQMVMVIDGSLPAYIPKGSLSVPEHLIIGMHAALWAVAGVGIGLGVGIASVGLQLDKISVYVLLATVGGMLGGMLYPILTAVSLPAVDASLPFPPTMSARLLWLGLPSLLMGLTLGRKVH